MPFRRVAVIAAICLGVATPSLSQSVPDLAAVLSTLEAGDHALALNRLETYVRARPQDPEGFALLARAGLLANTTASLRRAEEAARTAAKLLGRSRPDLEWTLGLILAAQGKLEPALARLRIAASGYPRGPNAREVYRYAMDWGAVAWRAGDPRQALEAYARASRAAPDEPWPFLHQGTLQLALGQPAAAERALSRAVELTETPVGQRPHPARAEALYWRGQAREAQGRYAEAGADYRAALGASPGHAAARDALEGVRTR